MTRFEHHLTRAGRTTLALLTLLCLIVTTGFGTHHPAPPVERPFRGTYEGNLTVPATEPVQPVAFTVMGNATHLGYFQMDARGTLYLSELRLDEGFVTFTAANGDKLYTHYTSQGRPMENSTLYEVVGDHSIQDGTGRFEGATGHFTTISYAQLLKTTETVTISGKVYMEGTISY